MAENEKKALVHFFDITSTLMGPRKSWSPNTLKTRMALNYKKIPYSQSFIEYPDIKGLLENIGIPALHYGPIPYTLPAIVHYHHIAAASSSGTRAVSTDDNNGFTAINDSFSIAVYLEENFAAPTYPSLFPNAGSYALAVAVQKIVAGLNPKCLPLTLPCVPDFLDQRSAEYFRSTRRMRFGKPLEELKAEKGTEAFEKAFDAVTGDLELLLDMLKGGPMGEQGMNKNTGPFFEGEDPGYADMIVVAFLAWCERIDKEDFWLRLVSMGNGEFRRLWDACLPWLEGQGEDSEFDVGKA